MKQSKLKTITIGCCIAVLSACSPSQNQLGKNLSNTSQEPSLHLGFSDSNYIVNGEPVKTDELVAKSTVALYLAGKRDDGSVQGICTATLIAKDVILTAGHCIKDVAEVFLKIPLESLIARLRVGFGLPRVTKESDSQVTFLKVKKVLVHPNYESEMVKKAKSVAMPDLTVILLDGEAPAGYEPVALGTDINLIEKGANITLAGYGYTSGSEFTLPTQLMKVDVSITEPKMTSAQFSYTTVDGKTACMGDSGGPAYMKGKNGEFFVVGVTSWGDSSCSRYGVYTNVPAFSDFILNSMASLHQQN